MAHTNQTSNYELSQFLGTDKPAWLVDYNGDMEKIDLGMKAAQDVADAAKTEADQGAIDIAAVTVTANSADAKATGAVSDLADAYDSTSTYNVGDYVIYNNILYRCITAITVPESFDGTHWARTTVEEIIAQVNSNLSDINKYFKASEMYSTTRVVSAGLNQLTDFTVFTSIVYGIADANDNGNIAGMALTNYSLNVTVNAPSTITIYYYPKQVL
jgi:hypothetical protein